LGLWLDLGLGKTISTLTAIVDLENDFGFDRCLVIAPKRVALSVWPREVKEWAHTAHLDMAVAVGSAKERAAALAQDATITVINRENVKWLVDTVGAKAWPWDLVVIDESDSFKDRGSARFRALKTVRPRIRRMIQLTGTPTPQGLLDLWAQIFLLDGGVRLGRSMTTYKERWFHTTDYMGYKWAPVKGAEAEIHKAVSDIVVSMSAEDYLQMPARIDNFIQVELPSSARKIYTALEKEFLIKLDAHEVAAANEAVLTNKLLQAANGALYVEEGKYTVLHDAKLDALEEVVEGALGGPVLVAYNFKSDLARILKRFPKAVALGQDVAQIEAWNRGEIPILCAHPASAGHGLNLQTGGSVLCWFGMNWSLGLYQQMNARLHRQGQRETVIVHHIVAKDTIDETVVRSLSEKHGSQSALLAALKADIRSRT
jgi:SNF2 family DNA or RNA helicase